jgi:hypothetical protein
MENEVQLQAFLILEDEGLQYPQDRLMGDPGADVNRQR